MRVGGRNKGERIVITDTDLALLSKDLQSSSMKLLKINAYNFIGNVSLFWDVIVFSSNIVLSSESRQISSVDLN